MIYAKREKVRSSYTASFKLKVVKFAEENNKMKASKQFGVHRKRVQKWCKQKEELQKVLRNAKVLKGRGQKVTYPDIESRLLEWIKSIRNVGGRLTRKALRRECLRLHKLYGNQSFKASSGWYRHFKKRNNIVMRRITHISQKPKKVTDDLVLRFQRQIIKMRRNRNYDLS